jgi:hypothetical protein
MERNVVELFVPYTIKGVTKEKCFKIGFVSNRIEREYRKLNAEVAELLSLSKTHQSILEHQLDVFKSDYSRKEKQERFKELKDQQEKIEARINAIATKDFFQSRVDLAIRILEANGCEDKEAMKAEFWDELVEPADFVIFLDRAVTKDYSKPTEKKK